MIRNVYGEGEEKGMSWVGKDCAEAAWRFTDFTSFACFVLVVAETAVHYLKLYASWRETFSREAQANQPHDATANAGQPIPTTTSKFHIQRTKTAAEKRWDGCSTSNIFSKIMENLS